MTARILAWPAGLIASALVNAGALAGLGLYLAPQPIVDQPRPETHLDVAAYRLDRTRASQAAPQPNRVPEGQASSDPTAAGALADAIPVTSATARPPDVQPLAATPSDLAPADPADPPAQALPSADTAGAQILATAPSFSGLSAAAPQNARLPDTAPTVSPVSDLPPPALPARSHIPAPSVIDPARPSFAVASTAEAPATGLPPTRPSPEGIDPTKAAAFTADAALPEALPVDTARPASTTAIAAAVDPDPASSAQPARAEAQSATPSVNRAFPARGQASRVTFGTARLDSAPAIAVTARPAAPEDPRAQRLSPGTAPARPLPQAEPQAVHMQASLAFAGGDGDIDPVSLAAFQSFVAPGATQTQDTLRDGLQGLLASVQCSRLQVAFDPDTASLRLDGHIPEDGLRAGILGALQAEMGDDITVSDNMALLPRPQCGALSGISQVGLPQSTDQATNPLLIGETLHARVLDFTDGELMYFDLTAPDYDAYVYVDYYDADGNVLHLSPNADVPLIFARAETTFRVGAASQSDPGLKLFVGPPFGQEIAVAFAASTPLADQPRPIAEPAGPYLDWLKTRVAEARATDPDFKGEWVYFFVTTSAG
ncbi:MAG: hypothetical protein CML68_12085 [Rhodobacteraceae bacterium]|nr:hypothetical protein [Paracoccaceae bacterium]